MQRKARVVLAVLGWMTVVVIIVQFFLAGVGLFGVAGMETHMLIGYWVPLPPLLMLVAAWPARVDRRTGWLIAGLFGLLIVQTSLPAFRDDLPVIAALHPPNALLSFWLSVVVARRLMELLRQPRVRVASPSAGRDRADVSA